MIHVLGVSFQVVKRALRWKISAKRSLNPHQETDKKQMKKCVANLTQWKMEILSEWNIFFIEPWDMNRYIFLYRAFKKLRFEFLLLCHFRMFKKKTRIKLAIRHSKNIFDSCAPRSISILIYFSFLLLRRKWFCGKKNLSRKNVETNWIETIKLFRVRCQQSRITFIGGYNKKISELRWKFSRNLISKVKPNEWNFERWLT